MARFYQLDARTGTHAYRTVCSMSIMCTLINSSLGDVYGSLREREFDFTAEISLPQIKDSN